MTNAIVQHGDIINDLDELQRVAKMYAVSALFSAKGDNMQAIAQIATQIMAGRELGIGPFASVQGIHIIKGRPSMSANLMAAKVKAHPHYNYKVREMSDKNVSVEFFEDGESLGTSSFSAEDAKRAETQNMGKFPRNMLFARAMSNGVRWFCPDVFSGQAVYTPDELGAAVDDDGDVVIAPPQRNGYKVVEQPEPEPARDELFNVEPKQTEATHATADDEAATIIANAKLTAPPAAQKWAVDNHYCGNEHHARNRWLNIVKQDFNNKVTRDNMQAVIHAFVSDCLAKGIEQTAVAV